ncbi:condensation domain-containing protein [Micromonospora sp. NBC_01796]|uniref:condensation domain-containing protein n=1 Tax=Micromonospora sp. NBC_01796 TaxID=2975987 RepID=UPI002DD8DC52|nr:condensation domain-containing protein [Micromonospora sp. NBC_01796]WSA84220.1 condensation domain-containing protein [Micromonospora sp. NBC_01796]
MTFEEVLEYVSVADVRLTGVDGTLRYDAPAAVLTPELMAGLRSYKGELLRWLAGPADEREVTRAPLSAQQNRMMENVERTGNSSGWNVGLRLELVGDLDVAALDAAVDGLLARHHALRARLGRDGDTRIQRILAHRPVPLPVVDLTALPDDETRTRAEAACRAVVEPAFDLADEAPVRYALIRLDRNESWLVLVVHHIACDGWAISVLLRDLAAGYRSAHTGGTADFGPPAAQCTGYARWQRDQWDEPTRRRRLTHWAEHLGDGPLTLDLPFDGPAPDRPTGRAATHRFEIPDRVRLAAQALARARGATVNAVTAAAMAVLLARLSGQPDVTLSVPHANRSPRAYEEAVAVMTTALPLRIRTAAATFGELVDQTAAGLFAGIDNLLPTAWIYGQFLGPAGGGMPSGVMVSFAFQNTLDMRLELPDLTVRVRDVPTDAERGALMFGLVPHPDRLDGYLEYPLDRLTDETARRWVAEYVELLADACADPDRPLPALDRHPAL